MSFTGSLPYPGETAAFLAAACWTVTAMSFEFAGKRVGSLAVNILRLIFAMVPFAVYGAVVRNHAIPLDATGFTWTWMSISGLIGFCFGDLCLFRAFVVVGSRISMLIMSAVPPLTALIGWWLLGERLSPTAWLGMAMTVGGILLVVGSRKTNGSSTNADSTVKGVLFALGGAVGQAVGLVISKYGMGSFDAVAATHIRVLAGTAGFIVIFTLSGQWPRVMQALHHRVAMRGILLGSVFGPFLGVTFSLLAVQNTDAGIASTIMSIVPVMIIPPAIIFFKEKLTVPEAAGSVLAVAGVSLLFL